MWSSCGSRSSQHFPPIKKRLVLEISIPSFLQKPLEQAHQVLRQLVATVQKYKKHLTQLTNSGCAKRTDRQRELWPPVPLDRGPAGPAFDNDRPAPIAMHRRHHVRPRGPVHGFLGAAHALFAVSDRPNRALGVLCRHLMMVLQITSSIGRRRLRGRFEKSLPWERAWDGAVNKRLLSTRETGEFAGENVGFGPNPGGWTRGPTKPLFQPERTRNTPEPAECGGYGR